MNWLATPSISKLDLIFPFILVFYNQLQTYCSSLPDSMVLSSLIPAFQFLGPPNIPASLVIYSLCFLWEFLGLILLLTFQTICIALH